MSVGEPIQVQVCEECGAISRPPATENVHEEGCPRSLPAQEERGEQSVTVDGEPALFKAASQAPLVELTTEELIGNVVTMERRFLDADRAAKKASKAKADALADYHAAVGALTLRYAKEHGQTTLPLSAEEQRAEDDAMAALTEGPDEEPEEEDAEDGG